MAVGGSRVVEVRQSIGIRVAQTKLCGTVDRQEGTRVNVP
jgi:hypothetical protein